MSKKTHRIRICGQTHNNHEQTIELSDEELLEFRKQLDAMKEKGDQAIDNYLGEQYGDTDPIDWEYSEWSAELLGDNDSVIENLDEG